MQAGQKVDAGMTSSACAARQCWGPHDVRRSTENLMSTRVQTQVIAYAPCTASGGTHVAGGGKENLISNLKGAAGQDDQPREQVLQDLSACQTNSQTAHSSDRQHTVDCSKGVTGAGLPGI